jgi:hypothetical protein
MITFYRTGFMPKDRIQRIKARDRRTNNILDKFPIGDVFRVSSITHSDEEEAEMYWIETTQGKVGLCKDLILGAFALAECVVPSVAELTSAHGEEA